MVRTLVDSRKQKTRRPLRYAQRSFNRGRVQQCKGVVFLQHAYYVYRRILNPTRAEGKLSCMGIPEHSIYTAAAAEVARSTLLCRVYAHLSVSSRQYYWKARRVSVPYILHLWSWRTATSRINISTASWFKHSIPNLLSRQSPHHVLEKTVLFGTQVPCTPADPTTVGSF